MYANASRRCSVDCNRRPGKTGGSEGGEADLGLLCSPQTLSRWHPSMDTEAEAIQSSPRFFLVSAQSSSLANTAPRTAALNAERRTPVNVDSCSQGAQVRWTSQYPALKRFERFGDGRRVPLTPPLSENARSLSQQARPARETLRADSAPPSSRCLAEHCLV